LQSFVKTILDFCLAADDPTGVRQDLRHSLIVREPVVIPRRALFGRCRPIVSEPCACPKALPQPCARHTVGKDAASGFGRTKDREGQVFVLSVADLSLADVLPEFGGASQGKCHSETMVVLADDVLPSGALEPIPSPYEIEVLGLGERAAKCSSSVCSAACIQISSVSVISFAHSFLPLLRRYLAAARTNRGRKVG